MDEQRQCDREPDDRDRDAVAISAWFESVHRQRAARLAVGIANGCRGRSAHWHSIALAAVRVTHLRNRGPGGLACRFPKDRDGSDASALCHCGCDAVQWQP